MASAVMGMDGVQAERPQRTFAEHFAFRFVFVYLSVYAFPSTLIVNIPGVEEVFSRLDRALVLWFGSHVLALAKPITIFPNGSGDTTYNYVQIACYAALALAAACVWSVLDRRRTDYRTLHELLRIYVRYALGIILLGYGMNKVLKAQFPRPDLDVLMESYGESSPMRLLWTFMGYSPIYTGFAGIAEVVPGLMLYFRRTTMAGALLGGAVMLNVVLLNFSYDVPVKLYSTHLFLMCIFLLVPELRRLADFLFFNRAVAPARQDWPWSGNRWMRQGRWIVKPIYIAIGLFLIGSNAVSGWKSWGDRAPRPPLYGAYEVEAAPPNAAQPGWQRVFINAHRQFLVELTDHTRRRFVVQDDGHGALTLTQGDNQIQLAYTRPDSQHLGIKGTLEDRPVDLLLRKLPERDFLLLNRGFHWINEYPFNR